MDLIVNQARALKQPQKLLIVPRICATLVTTAPPTTLAPTTLVTTLAPTLLTSPAPTTLVPTTLAPTTVLDFAEWNSADKHADITLSGGDLTATYTGAGGAWRAVRANQGKAAGKWYWEITIDNVNQTDIGVMGSGEVLSNFIGYGPTGYSYYSSTGNKYNNNVGAAYGAPYSTGVIVSVALDMDNGKIWFAYNGAWMAAGDPAAGTNFAYSGLAGTLYPAMAMYSNGSARTVNFGQNAFTYAVPAGFNAGVYV